MTKKGLVLSNQPFKFSQDVYIGMAHATPKQGIILSSPVPNHELAARANYLALSKGWHAQKIGMHHIFAVFLGMVLDSKWFSFRILENPNFTMNSDFKNRCTAKLQSFFDDASSKQDFRYTDGAVTGFVSAGKDYDPRNNGYSVWVLCTSFGGGSTRYRIWVPEPEIADVDAYVELAKDYFLEKGFVPAGKPLSPDSFGRILHLEILKSKAAQPQKFVAISSDIAAEKNIPPSANGIYKTAVVLPPSEDRNNRSIGLRIALRPIYDYLHVGNEYLEEPMSMDISTYAYDLAHVEELMKVIPGVCEKQGFFEYDLSKISQKNRADKKIPTHWIDPEKIKIHRKPNDKNYSLIIVMGGNNKPRIVLSLGTDDAQRAEEMCAYVVHSFLPSYASEGEKYGQPITLNVIKEFIQGRFAFTPREKPKAGRSDKRIIMTNGKARAQLFTPSLEHVRRADGETYHGYIIKIAPPLGSDVSVDSSSCLCGGLNTSDPDLALARLKVLQNLAVIALTQYFDENPGTDIHVEMQEKKRGKRKMLAFAVPKPGQQSQPNKVHFATLAEEHIKPALRDFERYMYWQTKLETVADNKTCNITFQAMRNNGETIPTDVSLFTGSFSIVAKDKIAAQSFIHTLELEMLREQEFFSRERPVSVFGEASANVVIRESLRIALRAHADLIDLQGNNLLTQLQKDKGPDFH